MSQLDEPYMCSYGDEWETEIHNITHEFYSQAQETV